MSGNERDWKRMRLGKVTSSRFGDLMKSGRKKDELWSAAGLAYMDGLVCERLGGQLPEISSAAIDWGNKHELLALQEYSDRVDHEVHPNPFSYFSYNEDIGGTPDAFAGNSADGCVEVKCPYNGARHIRTLRTREVPEEYIWQVHGHMMVAAKQWCDFVSFDPRLTNKEARLVIITVPRNEEKIEELRCKTAQAVEHIKKLIKQIGGSSSKSAW